jgi:hypothetical protein
MNLEKPPVIDWSAVRKTLLSIQPITVGKWLCAVAGLGVLACLIQQCLTPQPIVLPPAPITQAPGITHIPSRTLVPQDTKTWTKTVTPSLTRTVAARIFSPIPTLTEAPKSTATPTVLPVTPTWTSSPTATRIPAGRDTLPVTGLSEQEISELTPTITATVEPTATPLTLPDGCKFHSLLLESDKDYTELTFRCPNGEKTAEPVGD